MESNHANIVVNLMTLKPELLQHQEQEDGNPQPGLDIFIKGFSIHVTESTSMLLLESVLKAVRHPHPPQYSFPVRECFSLFRSVESSGLNFETCANTSGVVRASWWPGITFHSSLGRRMPFLLPTDFRTVFPYAISPR